jgi:hypothetical protein
MAMVAHQRELLAAAGLSAPPDDQQVGIERDTIMLAPQFGSSAAHLRTFDTLIRDARVLNESRRVLRRFADWQSGPDRARRVN